MSIENGTGAHKKTVGAAVSPALYQEIKRVARMRGVTVSTLIKRALEEHVDHTLGRTERTPS